MARRRGPQADGMHSEHEPSGEVLFLVLGVAVYLTVAVICAAAFLPPTAGVIVALTSVRGRGVLHALRRPLGPPTPRGSSERQPGAPEGAAAFSTRCGGPWGH